MSVSLSEAQSFRVCHASDFELKREQVGAFQFKAQTHLFSSQRADIRTGLPRDNSVHLIAEKQFAVVHHKTLRCSSVTVLNFNS